MADIGERIRELRKATGLTREAFASALDEKPSKIQDVESGRQRVNDEFLRKLISHFPVDLNWLFDASGFGGTAGYPRIEPPDSTRPLAGHFAADGEDYSLIRRLDLSVSAGSGLEPVADGVIERLALSRTWLIRQGLSADLCVLVRVKGDSMAPTIPDGALVLVNVADKLLREPGIYAFTYDGAAFIKRIAPAQFGPDGWPTSVAIIADNQAYAPQVLVGSAINAITVAGRVKGAFAFF